MAKRNQNFFILNTTIERLNGFEQATGRKKGPTTDTALNLYFDLQAALSQSPSVTVSRNQLGEIIFTANQDGVA